MSKKIYYDADGNERTISQMVKVEPEWAANIIQEDETRIKELEGEKNSIYSLVKTAKFRSENMINNNADCDFRYEQGRISVAAKVLEILEEQG